MRSKLVAGNWKMHKNAAQTQELLTDLLAKIPTQTTAEVIVAHFFQLIAGDCFDAACGRSH